VTTPLLLPLPPDEPLEEELAPLELPLLEPPLEEPAPVSGGPASPAVEAWPPLHE
jgi:hypothetical protein